MVFLFAHRGQYTFHPPGNPADRILLTETAVGENAKYLKSNLPVQFKKIDEEVNKISNNKSNKAPIAPISPISQMKPSFEFFHLLEKKSQKHFVRHDFCDTKKTHKK